MKTLKEKRFSPNIERFAFWEEDIIEFINSLKKIANEEHYNWSITKIFKEIDKLSGFEE